MLLSAYTEYIQVLISLATPTGSRQLNGQMILLLLLDQVRE